MAAQLIVSDISATAMDGLQARLHDPLWTLARQWQMGELNGEDAGSPIGARLKVETAPIGPLKAEAAQEGGAVVPVDSLHSTLEYVVEAEAWDTPRQPHGRLSAETGLQLERALRGAALGVAVPILRAGFVLARNAPTSTHLPSARFLRVMAGRVTDGCALYRRLAPLFTAGGLNSLPDEEPFSSLADRELVRPVLDRWMRDCRRVFGDTFTVSATSGNAAAWQRARMEYAFSLGVKLGDRAHELLATEYFEGTTDWSTFDIDPARTVGESVASSTTMRTFLPTPVRFRGMPSSRFWEIENSRVNLPKVGVARKSTPSADLDPASRLFLDFTVRYGNDWFSVPLPQTVGTASRITSLVVSTTFGERFLVRHANAGRPDASWQMFALTINTGESTDAAAIAAAREVFLLPATASQILQSLPMEEVRLVRDEMANLAWAIEGIVESPAALRVDRAEQYARNRPPPVEPTSSPTGAIPRFLLGSAIPDFWIPLLPQAGAPGQPAMLARGAIPQMQNGEIVGGLDPEGRILEPRVPLLIFDEEIPREGTVVTRRYRLSRATDGTTNLWLGRAKSPARGEASSGLRFDTLDPPT